MATSAQNRGPEFLAVFGTGTAVAAVTVILRLWVRARIIRKIGADDWIVLLSLVLVFGTISCMASSVHHGLGRHIQTLTSEQASNAMKILWIGFCVTPSAEATAKISITIMLMRITTSAKWKYFFVSLITLMIMITIASLFAILMSCWPIQLLWDPTLQGHCNVLERTVVIYIQGVMAAGYDVILAASPVFLLWNVKIGIFDKALLCGLLALGFFTSAAGILRTVYTPDTLDTQDPTYAVLDFLIWKTVELPLSIIVGCLPTLRPLFKKKDRTGPYQKYDDTIGLTDRRMDQQIRKTTSIDMNFTGNSSGDTQSSHPQTWDLEGRR